MAEKIGIYSLALGTLLGIAAQTLVQLIFIYKIGLRISFLPSFKDQYLKEMSRLALPVLLSTGVGQISILVDRIMASGLPDGAISSLAYAGRLQGFVTMIFVSSLATVYFPAFSELATNEDKKPFIDSFNSSLKIIALFIIPMMIGLAVLRVPIIELLFQRGAFDSKATTDTALALLMFSFGLLSIAIREILNRVFYSLQDTKTPMVNASIAVIFNIILNSIFIKFLGHAGLALGTSISSSITVTLLIYSLRKKLGHIGGKEMLVSFMKMGLAGLIMGIIAFILHGEMPYFMQGNFSKALHLFSVISISGLSYFILAYLIGVEEISQGINLIKRKMVKQRNLSIN